MEERRNSDNIMRKKIKCNHIKQKIDGGLNLKLKRKEVSVRKLRMGNGNLEKIFVLLFLLKTEYLRSLLNAASLCKKKKMRLLGKAGADLQSLPGVSLVTCCLQHLVCWDHPDVPRGAANCSPGCKMILMVNLLGLLMRRQSHHPRMQFFP